MIKSKVQAWQVAVTAPLFKPLTYISDLDLKPGLGVVVPIGKRKVQGVVLKKTKTPTYKLKKIESKISDLPILNKVYIEFINWMGSYYIYPLGMVFKLFHPPLKKKLDKFKKPKPSVKHSTLNKEQEEIVKNIDLKGGFKVHLIHGITGSGKTEVYLKLIEKTNSQVLFLVPEISLTPQLETRFRGKFGEDISVIHSKLTNRVRANSWWNMAEGLTKILIGARSAIFCPIKKLGLIIIDEEHDQSFKQNEGFKYNAKHASIMLAKFLDIPIILGSATPSLESIYNKTYKLHFLRKRFGSSHLPKVLLEDMTNTNNSSLPYWLGNTLYEKINHHLSSGHQVALFLNRRGQSYLVCCSNCGEGVKCPNCSVSLTKHRDLYLVCHYCNYHRNLGKCEFCNKDMLKAIGIGTEGIQNDLAKLFPKHKIIRADSDIIRGRLEYLEFIKNIEENKADILVGTGMISKGLNFPNLTLVGIVSLDTILNMPDFRAEEKAFQLLLQVSGRAGRFGQNAEVVIQTMKPEDRLLKLAAKYDYDSFYKTENALRKSLNYPPFGRLAMIRTSSIDRKKAEKSIREIADFAFGLRSKSDWFDVLGPAPSPLSKLRGRYRFQTLLKSDKKINLSQICDHIRESVKLVPSVRLSIDIDPINPL